MHSMIRTVRMVFLACHKIDPSGGELFHEIWLDMNGWAVDAAKKRLKDAPPDPMRPRTEPEARQALLNIIDQSVARLKSIAEGNRKRAEANAGLEAELLAFDASPEGERLRRYEISCSRTLIRTLDAFDKLHRSGDDHGQDEISLFIPASTDVVLTDLDRNVGTGNRDRSGAGSRSYP